MQDVIIIGSGPVGLYAATLCAMHNLDAIVLESSHLYGGTLNLYKEKNIYDMPGFPKTTAGELILSLYQQYLTQQQTDRILLNIQILDFVHEEDHYKVITNKGVYLSKTILFCNGGGMFRPRPLGLPNEKAFDNIHYFVERLSDFKDKDITILGGGDSAIDFALSLQPYAKSINVVHRRADFRAHENNVLQVKSFAKVYTPYEPIHMEGTTKVASLVIKHLETKETTTLKTDALLVFYGNVPIKPDYEAYGIKTDNGLITVKTNMETSHKGIYAAGNSVTYPGKIKMISSGMGEAATAVSSISKYLNPKKTMTYKH